MSSVMMTTTLGRATATARGSRAEISKSKTNDLFISGRSFENCFGLVFTGFVFTGFVFTGA